VFTAQSATKGSWRRVNNVKSDFILTNDPTRKTRGNYRADNHAWFFGWSDNEGACALCLRCVESRIACLGTVCAPVHCALAWCY
jgi:hypothetical protein